MDNNTPTLNVHLLPKQMEFIKSYKKFTCYCGGLGSGKTYALCWWIIIMALKHKQSPGLITNNTYDQLHSSTLVTLFEILDDFNIPYHYYKHTTTLKIAGGATIFCKSMENYHRLRGIEVGWWAGDEAAFYKKDAYQTAIARIRHENGPHQVKLATTPNGLNWLYSTFVENTTTRHKLITSSSYENEFLPEDYIEALKGDYDTRTQQQELMGQFINNTEGQVYYMFDRSKHVSQQSLVPWPGEILYIGSDFNVSPITSVICLYRGECIHIFDEIYQNDSNTFELAREIAKRYPNNPIWIYPDAAGSARKTSATKSDHEILKQQGFTLKNSLSNPPVKDRYNATNNLLEKNRIIINHKCKFIIRDLEKMTYDNNDNSLSHISDALGYLVWGLAPIQKQNVTTFRRF